MTPMDIGVSIATSSAADSGHLVMGDFNVSGGGKSAGLLSTSGNTSIWVYVAIAVAAIVALWLWKKK